MNRHIEDDLRAAVVAGIIDQDAATKLTAFLDQRRTGEAAASSVTPKFDAAHLLWYAGALIVIGAMGLFSTLAFSRMGGIALVLTAIAYAAVFTAVGSHLWHRKNLRVPGGLLIAIAVSMAPLAVYGVQDMLDWHGLGNRKGSVRDFYIWIRSSWIFMEIAALLAAALALRFFRFPFIVSIVAVALWFMSMDLAPWIAGTEYAAWELRRTVSLWFGLGVVVAAWIVDQRNQGADFAFWLHLFGLLTFWSAVTATYNPGEWSKALYCLLNIGLLVLSVVLQRRVYAVFGAIGVAIYLGHLAEQVFRDSLLFPFALSLIGVAVIAAGLLYHRKQESIASWLAAHLPNSILRLRPAHARKRT